MEIPVEKLEIIAITMQGMTKFEIADAFAAMIEEEGITQKLELACMFALWISAYEYLMTDYEPKGRLQ